MKRVNLRASGTFSGTPSSAPCLSQISPLFPIHLHANFYTNGRYPLTDTRRAACPLFRMGSTSLSCRPIARLALRATRYFVERNDQSAQSLAPSAFGELFLQRAGTRP